MSHSSLEHKSSSVTLTQSVVRSFEPVKTFGYHKGASITSLDFDDTGQYMISSGVDKSIQLYDIHKGVHHQDIQSQKYGAHLARFTHHELNCLYSSTPGRDMKVDNAIRYLSLASNQYLRYFKGHKEQVIGIEVDPVHDVFLSSSLDRSVKVWDLRTVTPVGNIDAGKPSVIAFDPKGMVFAVGKPPNPRDLGDSEDPREPGIPGVSGDLSTSTGTVEFYDMATFDKGPFLKTNISLAPGLSWVKLEFSNNGKLLLLSTDGPLHYVLDAFLGQLLTKLSMVPSLIDQYHHQNWLTFKYPTTGPATFSPCGKFVLAGTPNLSVQAFDISNLKSTEGDSTFFVESDNNPTTWALEHLHANQAATKIISFNPKLLTFATADTLVSLWQYKKTDTI